MIHRAGLVLAALLLGACGKSSPVSPTAVSSDTPREYTIRWGDTLEEIAWKFDVPGGFPALAELNNLRNPHVIGAGAHLMIPPTRPARDRLPPIPSSTRQRPAFRACPVSALPAPMPTAISGCVKAACVALDQGRQVCACEGAPDAQGIHIFDGGQPQLEWSVAFSAYPGDEWEQLGTVLDFEVSRVQLDDDPELEIAVASLHRRNDVGMSWWNVALLDGPAATRALHLDVANYGAGSFVEGKGGQCNVLSTSWELDRRPHSEGYGYYLTARPMAMSAGELAPFPGEPLWMRRLLFSYRPGIQLRSSGLSVSTPAFDLAHAQTEARVVEPTLRLERLRDLPVVIHSSKRAERSQSGELHLLTDKGTLITGSGSQFLRLGDQATGRLYPDTYVPAASLANRSAVLSEYASTWGTVRRVLWLAEL